MSLHTFSIEEKIEAIDAMIAEAKRGGPPKYERFTILKSIAADLRARAELPRSNALGEITRALDRLKDSKTALGYDRDRMAHVANVVISKWPTISQALEQFGEESAE